MIYSIVPPEQLFYADIKQERMEVSINGEKVILGIRPENLKLTSEGQNTVKGEIYVVEPLGRDKLVNVKIGTNRIKVIAPQDYNGNMGENVFVRLDMDKIHLFSSEDGNSLRMSA